VGKSYASSNRFGLFSDAAMCRKTKIPAAETMLSINKQRNYVNIRRARHACLSVSPASNAMPENCNVTICQAYPVPRLEWVYAPTTVVSARMPPVILRHLRPWQLAGAVRVAPVTDTVGSPTPAPPGCRTDRLPPPSPAQSIARQRRPARCVVSIHSPGVAPWPVATRRR